ncbi:MAG TPA: MFS transporter, partial [Beijerinckiaceae bacterium]|nr:MFS transporter [Beijerinckiaceae bacterium]
MSERQRTPWPIVALLLGAGLFAACQVGKAAIAVPALRRGLDLTLAEASWVVGLYGALGAAGGLVAGALVTRLGTRMALLGGLALIALGSAAGAFATGLASLLITRALEGCGFLAVAIAAPAILDRVAAPADRHVAFALWGAYMPLGTALMMMAGPFLLAFGWRGLWAVSGAAVLLYAIVLHMILPRAASGPARRPGEPLLPRVWHVLRAPGPLLLALGFGFYTSQYFALTALFPTLLVERMGLSIGAAGLVSALVVLANALGNLAAGALVRLGAPLWATIAGGFASVALLSFGVFSDLPTALVCACAAASLALSGTIPASIFAALPRLAPAPFLVPVAFGLVMQASNVGQLVGPVALAPWVEAFTWSSAPIL